MIKKLTCIECPLGCEIEAEVDGEQLVSVSGYGCLRGKKYAESEVVCPRRVVTSTVRAENGALVPVKTDKPVKKEEIFSVMKKINAAVCNLPVSIGDVIVENITEDICLIATGDCE